MTVADLNQDGNDDLVFARNTANLLYFKGAGDGTFQTGTIIALPRIVNFVDAQDFDNDGRPDLGAVVPGNLFAYFIKVMSNRNNTFTITETLAPGGGDTFIYADFDRDGKKDIILAGYDNADTGGANFFAGDGLGGFATPQAFKNLGGKALSAGDFNNDGIADFAAEGIIYYNNTPISPCLSISDASVTEPDSGTVNADFTVTLSQASSDTVTAGYRVVGRTATVGTDTDVVTGTVTFNPGDLSKTISVPVRGDTLNEATETFNLHLFNPVNASLKDGQGKGTITDNDVNFPAISIGDASTTEGSGGTTNLAFDYTLSGPSGRLTKIGMATQNGTAVSPDDFTAFSGTIGIQPGSTSGRIVIPIKTDTLVEPDENFRILLGSPVFLTVADGDAAGTIANDDFGGTVEFTTSSFEVNENAGTATITIKRTGGAASGINFEYLTSDGTATTTQDYQARSGSFSLAANEMAKSFTVPITNDSRDEEPVETVNLTLRNITGGAVLGVSSAVLNINDDDLPPQLTSGSINVNEGNTGSAAANFTVNLSAVSDRTISVNYATANGTATAPSDYAAASGTLTFTPGQTSKTISVQVQGDIVDEQNETFFIDLSTPVNVTLQTTQMTATIVDDDSARRAAFDFDGDGKSDISVFRAAEGNWYLLQSTAGYTGTHFGIPTDKLVPADYDGDGKTDVAVFRDGAWYIMGSQVGFQAYTFGQTGDIPQPADFNGDGKSELCVFRPADGGWYKLDLNGNVFTGVTFGQNGDKPVVGDYDGDGKADPAVFRDGAWYILGSTQGYYGVNFGIATDKVVPADYDGDGKTDQAVVRDGFWYLLESTAGYTGFQWGLATDVPVAADYDGDGKADVSVYRDGQWYMLQTSAGYSGANFGLSTDKPVPNTFVQ